MDILTALMGPVLGAAMGLWCSVGLIRTLRRGWYIPVRSPERITRKDNPIQFWINIALYIVGCGIGIYAINLEWWVNELFRLISYWRLWQS
jgi:hypothetical protein